MKTEARAMGPALTAAPELISSTPFEVRLPPGAIISRRTVLWAHAGPAQLVVVTLTRFEEAPPITTVHRYDPSGHCRAAYISSLAMMRPGTGGGRLAFASPPTGVYVVDLLDGTLLHHRSETMSAILSETGASVALSTGYIEPGGLETGPVGDSTGRYFPPVVSRAEALWMNDENDVLYADFDRVLLYRCAADESERVCARLGRGAGGEWGASTDGSTVFYATRNDVFVYSVAERREIAKHRVSPGIASVSAGAHGLVAVGDTKGRVFLLRGAEKQLLRESPDPLEAFGGGRFARFPPRTLAFSRDSKELAWASCAAARAVGVIAL